MQIVDTNQTAKISYPIPSPAEEINNFFQDELENDLLNNPQFSIESSAVSVSRNDSAYMNANVTHRKNNMQNV